LGFKKCLKIGLVKWKVKIKEEYVILLYFSMRVLQNIKKSDRVSKKVKDPEKEVDYQNPCNSA
jgi:hypothetical protein